MGFLHFRGVLDAADVETWRARVDAVRPPDVRPWTRPDGVTRTPALWPLIWDPRVQHIARVALGARPQGNHRERAARRGERF